MEQDAATGRPLQLLTQQQPPHCNSQGKRVRGHANTAAPHLLPLVKGGGKGKENV